MKTLLKKLPKLIAVTMEISGVTNVRGRSSPSPGTSPKKQTADSPTKEVDAAEADSNEGFTAVIVNRCLKKA